MTTNPTKTYIPISRAKAERSSIVGVGVLLKSRFSASNWYGSGRERRGREKDGDAGVGYGAEL